MSRTLVSILAGLGGMFGWGTSDFFANLASDKVGHFRTFFWSQIAGISLFLLAFILIRPNFIFSWPLVLLILVAALGYGVGYLFFYKAFEIGNVSVVSTVINLNTILTMGVAFVVFGQRLTSVASIGVLMTIVGVSLVGVNFGELVSGKISFTRGVKEAVIASVLFGIFYWPVNEYITERAHWLSSSILIKIISLAIVFIIAVFSKTKLKFENKSKDIFMIVFWVGVLEAVGVLSTSFGVSVGDSILVAPIASALTIVTITLAIIFLKEKVSKLQTFGILMTVAGIILTAF